MSNDNDIFYCICEKCGKLMIINRYRKRCILCFDYKKIKI